MAKLEGHIDNHYPDFVDDEDKENGCHLHKDATHGDSNDDIESHMGPLNFCLKIFGLIYTNNTRWFTPSKVYHATVVAAMWFNFFKGFGIYEVGEPFGLRVICKLSIHFLMFMGASNATVGTLLSRKRVAMCSVWSEYGQRFSSGDVEETRALRKRKTRFALVAAWACVIFSVVGYACALWNARIRYIIKLVAVPLIPICRTDHLILDLTFSLVIQGTNSLVTAFQLCHMLLMILFLVDEFKIFNKQFLGALGSDDPSSGVGEHLEFWRQRHQHLCTLVDQLDDCIGMHALLMYVTILPVASCCVYSIVITMAFYSDQESFVETVVLDVLFLSVCAATLFVITYTGTMLNSQATACKQSLYNWDLTKQDWNATTSLQLTTFYNRLMEGHIGITGWKLFYINKLTAKMVILMVVSYSVILLKFGQNDREMPPLCPEDPANVSEIFNASTIAEKLL